jgi:carboxypeptidase D
MYCPYIASHFLDANDTTYFDVKGMHIYDPSIGDYEVTAYIPTNYFFNYWESVFPLNDTAKANLRNMSATCGFDDYMNKYLTYPPPGPQPSVLPGTNSTTHRLLRSCRTADYLADAATELNPGWNIYQVTQMLPIPDDVLGFPYSDFYVAPGRQIYFNRTDVKKAINAPLNVSWSICTDNSVFVNDDDLSLPSGKTVIPGIIDRTKNVMISHGLNDFVLIANGSLLVIQNMTWGGMLGFQSQPSSPLFVPHHPNLDIASASGQGVLGTTHTERGLTWSLVTLTGHMVPGWQAAVAYRQTEFLLGRVSSLSSTQPFAAYSNITQPSADSLGNGVGPQLGVLANSTNSTGGNGTNSSK